MLTTSFVQSHGCRRASMERLSEFGVQVWFSMMESKWGTEETKLEHGYPCDVFGERSGSVARDDVIRPTKWGTELQNHQDSSKNHRVGIVSHGFSKVFVKILMSTPKPWTGSYMMDLQQILMSLRSASIGEETFTILLNAISHEEGKNILQLPNHFKVFTYAPLLV